MTDTKLIYCPLRKDATGAELLCLREECAWWMAEEEKACALLIIPKNLAWVARLLQRMIGDC